MPFDKESRYMSKIHVILVVWSIYFLKKTVSTLNQIFFRKKNTNLSFKIFHYIQTKYSKEGKIKH